MRSVRILTATESGPPHIVVHRRRTDAVHANGRRELHRQRPGQMDDRALARAVGRYIGETNQTGDRAMIDDHTLTGRLKSRLRRATAEEGGFEIDVEGVVPERFIRVRHRSDREDPGVVDQNIQPAELRQCALDHLRTASGITQITWGRHGIGTQRRNKGGHLVSVPAIHSHPRTKPGKASRKRRAHASGRACDQHALVDEFPVLRTRFSSCHLLPLLEAATYRCAIHALRSGVAPRRVPVARRTCQRHSGTPTARLTHRCARSRYHLCPARS